MSFIGFGFNSFSWETIDLDDSVGKYGFTIDDVADSIGGSMYSKEYITTKGIPDLEYLWFDGVSGYGFEKIPPLASYGDSKVYCFDGNESYLTGFSDSMVLLEPSSDSEIRSVLVPVKQDGDVVGGGVVQVFKFRDAAEGD